MSALVLFLSVVAAAATETPTPTSIADVTVASDNPDVAPVVTLTARDGASVTLWWRTGARDWQATTMATGPSGLNIARLPDGVQRQGFSFFLEATGPTGATATFASRGAPIDVPPAVEGNRERVEKNLRDEQALGGPHPAFVLIALGGGMLAGAGAAAFGYDLTIVNGRIAEVDSELDGSPSDERAATLAETRRALENAQLQDSAATAIFGVVAGVALVAGAALLTVGALEQ